MAFTTALCTYCCSFGGRTHRPRARVYCLELLLEPALQAIYPIKYQDALKEYTIRGLELPADLYSMDDERISSALGYTAHLVCMLAKYLQVPLRYQVIYNASR